jgi:hypothetical protein
VNAAIPAGNGPVGLVAPALCWARSDDLRSTLPGARVKGGNAIPSSLAGIIEVDAVYHRTITWTSLRADARPILERTRLITEPPSAVKWQGGLPGRTYGADAGYHHAE